MLKSVDVPVFRHRESQDRIASYVSPRTKARISTLGKIWSGLSKLEDKKASKWSESETVNRLVDAALDMAETEMGISLDELKTDADIDRVLAAIAKRLGNSK